MWAYLIFNKTINQKSIITYWRDELVLYYKFIWSNIISVLSICSHVWTRDNYYNNTIIYYRTDLCQFSGFKIYPGHGKRIIRIDGKSFNIINAKCQSHFVNKKNPRKLRWTILYRRKHKKGLQVCSFLLYSFK